MPHVVESITIDRPLEEVFALASDPNAWPEWDPAIAEVRVDGPMAAGLRGVELRTQGGRAFEFPFEVIAFEPNRRFVVEGEGGSLYVRAELRAAAHDGATRVEFEGDFEPRGWLRLMTPLLARLIANGAHETLLGLKQHCERREA